MLDTLFAYFARYGYFVVFFGVMLENAGVPVPGETILLAAGFFAAQGIPSVETCRGPMRSVPPRGSMKVQMVAAAHFFDA